MEEHLDRRHPQIDLRVRCGIETGGSTLGGSDKGGPNLGGEAEGQKEAAALDRCRCGYEG